MNKYWITGTVLAVVSITPFVAISIIEEVDSHKKRLQEMELKERKAKEDKEFKEKKAKEDKERLDKELKDKEEYWASLSSEDKVAIENKKLETRLKEAEAKKAEADMKSSVDRFKNDILTEVREEALNYVKSDSKDLFNTWVASYQDKLDRKLERLSDKLDDKADDDDLDNLERKISRLSERIDDLPKGNSSCSTPSSSPITIAPVISGK